MKKLLALFLLIPATCLAQINNSSVLPSTGATTVTTLGTITTGTWNATAVVGTYGGTGVNNGANTITLGGNLTTSGASAITFTSSGTTNITLPTSGTLVTNVGLVTGGTKFTASGCTNSTTVGGATSGTFASGTTGTCTVVITMNGATGLASPTGWMCNTEDLTTVPALFTGLMRQTASNTTTATISGTTVSGDVINFSCIGY